MVKVVVMVVTIMLLSYDSQGPRIGQSFLILLIPIRRNNARQMDQWTNRWTNPLIEICGRI